MKTHFKELKPAGLFIGIVLGIAFMLMVSFTKSEPTPTPNLPKSSHVISKCGTATVYNIYGTQLYVVVGINGDVAIR